MSVVNAGTGFLYGCMLSICSFVAAGSGHGTMVPLYISSAPVSALGFGAGLLGPPLVWTLIGALVAESAKLPALRALLVLLLAHYASGIALAVSEHDGYAHLKHALDIAPEVFAIWAVTYGLGQIAIWARVLKRE